MSNFHFDLSLKLSQREVHDISGEVQKFSGEVRTSPHLPSTSYPGSFHYVHRWRKDPGPGWSRVSQILGDNNWDLWG
jgi:hypothetical protein